MIFNVIRIGHFKTKFLFYQFSEKKRLIKSKINLRIKSQGLDLKQKYKKKFVKIII